MQSPTRFSGRKFRDTVCCNRLRDLSAQTQPAPSEADLVWESAQRELQGQQVVNPKNAHRATAAIEVVRNCLNDFGGRLSLEKENRIRVAIYKNNKIRVSSEHTMALLAEQELEQLKRLAIAQEKARKLREQKIRFLDKRKPTYPYPSLLAECVVIDATGILSPPAQELAKSTAILGKVLEKKLHAAFPNEFWGVDLHGRPGELPVIAGNWGPVITVNLTFPVKTVSVDKSPTDDIWEETRHELRGESLPKGTKTISAARLLDLFKKTLAQFGTRVEGLPQDSAITLMVFDQGSLFRSLTNCPPAIVGKTSALGRIFDKKVMPTPSSYNRALDYSKGAITPARYVIQISSADLAAAREAELSEAELLERIRVFGPDSQAPPTDTIYDE